MVWVFLLRVVEFVDVVVWWDWRRWEFCLGGGGGGGVVVIVVMVEVVEDEDVEDYCVSGGGGCGSGCFSGGWGGEGVDMIESLCILF